MHGVVFKAYKQFLTDTYGEEFWHTVSDVADANDTYVALTSYPDSDLFNLIEETVVRVDPSQETLLREFGAYAAPVLADSYETLINDDWEAIDLLAHVEEHIHTALRTHDLEPPELGTTRVDRTTVTIEYGSDRAICSFALGLIDGVSGIYDADFEITHDQCQRDGADTCLITVQQTG